MLVETITDEAFINRSSPGLSQQLLPNPWVLWLALVLALHTAERKFTTLCTDLCPNGPSIKGTIIILMTVVATIYGEPTAPTI